MHVREARPLRTPAQYPRCWGPQQRWRRLRHSHSDSPPCRLASARATAASRPATHTQRKQFRCQNARGGQRSRRERTVRHGLALAALRCRSSHCALRSPPPARRRTAPRRTCQPRESTPNNNNKGVGAAARYAGGARRACPHGEVGRIEPARAASGLSNAPALLHPCPRPSPPATSTAYRAYLASRPFPPLRPCHASTAPVPANHGAKRPPRPTHQ